MEGMLCSICAHLQATNFMATVVKILETTANMADLFLPPSEHVDDLECTEHPLKSAEAMALQSMIDVLALPTEVRVASNSLARVDLFAYSFSDLHIVEEDWRKIERWLNYL